MSGTVPRLAGLAEVAGLAVVSRKRAWQLTQHKDFPEPAQVLAMGPVWRESDVLAFLAIPRRGGRQRIREGHEPPILQIGRELREGCRG